MIAIDKNGLDYFWGKLKSKFEALETRTASDIKTNEINKSVQNVLDDLGIAARNAVASVDTVKPDENTTNINLFRSITEQELLAMKEDPSLAVAGVNYLVDNDNGEIANASMIQTNSLGVSVQVALDTQAAELKTQGAAIQALEEQAAGVSATLLWEGAWGAYNSAPLTIPNARDYAFLVCEFGVSIVKVPVGNVMYLAQTTGFTSSTHAMACIRFTLSEANVAALVASISYAVSINNNTIVNATAQSTVSALKRVWGTNEP